jgi:hypothetical protein
VRVTKDKTAQQIGLKKIGLNDTTSCGRLSRDFIGLPSSSYGSGNAQGSTHHEDEDGEGERHEAEAEEGHEGGLTPEPPRVELPQLRVPVSHTAISHI